MCGAMAVGAGEGRSRDEALHRDGISHGLCLEEGPQAQYVSVRAKRSVRYCEGTGIHL